MKTFSLFSVPILACGGDDCKINLFIQQNGQVITAFCLLFRTFHSASSHMYLFFPFFFFFKFFSSYSLSPDNNCPQRPLFR